MLLIHMATARKAGNLIVVQPSRRRSVSRRRASRIARRVARRAGGAARSAALPTAILASSAALGWAQAKGHLNKLPKIAGSRAATIAIAGYAATRFTRNPMLRQLGQSAMIVAAFDIGAKFGGGKSQLEGDDSDISWDDSDV